MQEILGSSCNIIALALEIESKANMKEFKVTMGCIHLDLLPLEKVMIAPIPAIHPSYQPCLRYCAIINILDVQEARAPPADSLTFASGASTQGAAHGGGGVAIGAPTRHHLYNRRATHWVGSWGSLLPRAAMATVAGAS